MLAPYSFLGGGGAKSINCDRKLLENRLRERNPNKTKMMYYE